MPCNGDISSAGIGSFIFGNLSPGFKKGLQFRLPHRGILLQLGFAIERRKTQGFKIGCSLKDNVYTLCDSEVVKKGRYHASMASNPTDWTMAIIPIPTTCFSF